MTAHRFVRALAALLAAVVLVTSFVDDASAERRRRRSRRPTGCAAAPACAALGPDAQGAFAQLFASNVVAFESIGAAAPVPAEVTAVRILIADPAAPGAVDLLYRNGSLAGRVYAVIASWLIAPSEYHARREGLIHRSGGDIVTTTLGANSQQLSIHDLLSPHPGARRFPPGTNSFDAFCPGVMRNDDRAFQTDIAGGGASITMIFGPQVTRDECIAHANPGATPPTPPAAPVYRQIVLE